MFVRSTCTGSVALVGCECQYCHSLFFRGLDSPRLDKTVRAASCVSLTFPKLKLSVISSLFSRPRFLVVLPGSGRRQYQDRQRHDGCDGRERKSDFGATRSRSDRPGTLGGLGSGETPRKTRFVRESIDWYGQG